MSIPAGTRFLVRDRARYSCEFCGIREADAGGELTIDHYRPRAHGGGDHPDNLVYACSRCNLYKHDYWPVSDAAPRLWNPRLEPCSSHFIEIPDGSLKSRSPEGAFTLQQLRLNRPQLVEYRRRRRQTSESEGRLGLYEGIVVVLSHLLSQKAALADQQNELLRELRELLGQLLSSRS